MTDYEDVWRKLNDLRDDGYRVTGADLESTEPPTTMTLIVEVKR